MKFIISRQTAFRHEYWVSSPPDIWSTETQDAHQFDTFDEAYETMKEARTAFVNLLVEQYHCHVETRFGPLPSMYGASLNSILVSVPTVRGLLESAILFDLEVVIDDPKLPGEKKGD